MKNLIPYNKIRKEWAQNPEFKRIRRERAPQFTIVKQLVEARIKQNKTQADIAQMTGLKQAAISALESFSREPQLSTLCKVASALKIKALKIL